MLTARVGLAVGGLEEEQRGSRRSHVLAVTFYISIILTSQHTTDSPNSPWDQACRSVTSLMVSGMSNGCVCEVAHAP